MWSASELDHESIKPHCLQIIIAIVSQQEFRHTLFIKTADSISVMQTSYVTNKMQIFTAYLFI